MVGRHSEVCIVFRKRNSMIFWCDDVRNTKKHVFMIKNVTFVCHFSDSYMDFFTWYNVFVTMQRSA